MVVRRRRAKTNDDIMMTSEGVSADVYYWDPLMVTALNIRDAVSEEYRHQST